MERPNKKMLIVIIMIILALALTVAYAVLASQMDIVGTGKIDGAQWDVHFVNLQSSGLTTTGTANVKNVNLNSTVITLSVELEKPLDSVTYVFDVVNEGTLDAQMYDVKLPNMEALKANHIYYQISYYTLTNEELILSSDMTEEEHKAVIKKMNQDILTAGTLENEQVTISNNGKRRMKVYVQYKDINNEQFENSSMNFDLATWLFYKQATQ